MGAPMDAAAEVAAYLHQHETKGLLRFTDKTFVDPTALFAELQKSRQRGWAVDDEERTLGMRCVAAPMRNAAGEMVAAVGLSGPTARISPERLDALGRLVRDGAMELSASNNKNRTPA